MPRIPKYRLHKASGQACIQVRGKVIYLGKYKSPESRRKYKDILRSHLDGAAEPAKPPPLETDEVLVKDLILAYWEHVRRWYIKDGQPTSEQANIRAVLKNYVRPTYGETPAAEFDTLALEAIREDMITAELARSTIDQHVGRIRRMFKWGAGKKLYPNATSVYRDLVTLSGLGKGRSQARETAPVQPIADWIVDRTMAELSDVVAAMVRFQRLTGCRPGEVCIMRPMDIDHASDPWSYTPSSHKTEHHGHERRIYICRQAQEVLTPYMFRAEDAYLFSPREAAIHEADGLASRTQRDKSRRPRPGRRGTRYTCHSYRRAIHRACDRADEKAHREQPEIPVGQRIIPCWGPNRLRHTAATEIRKLFGPEAAQVVLGHKHLKVTEVYAERNFALAEEVARKLGQVETNGEDC